jgi:hypothetical protein
MDEKSRKNRIDASEVLRVTDIIPPFNHSASLRRNSDDLSKPSASRQSLGREGKSTGESRSTRVADSVSDMEIPRFDLAESILAEQRRVTARRRRRREPRQAQPEVLERENAAPQTAMPVPSPEELRELQQIVAEIVARDIERICPGVRAFAAG